MSINNKLLLSIIAFSLAITAAGIVGFITHNPNMNFLLRFGIFSFILSGGYLLAKHGTFIYSPEYRFVKLAIAIVLIGVLFKIMHWPFSAYMLILGAMSISILYLYHLIKNNRTKWSDFLKLFVILTVSVGRLFKIFHWPYSKEISVIGMIALLILVIDLVKRKKLYRD